MFDEADDWQENHSENAWTDLSNKDLLECLLPSANKFISDLLKTIESEVEEMKVNIPNCFCDGSGDYVNGFCDCEFSKNDALDQALQLLRDKIKE
uniref:Uncharacterized protein n=1 Tax=viral metagenome TaxID=1070528 RepID=A0A6H2A5V1_9ZZZZ